MNHQTPQTPESSLVNEDQKTWNDVEEQEILDTSSSVLVDQSSEESLSVNVSNGVYIPSKMAIRNTECSFKKRLYISLL